MKEKELHEIAREFVIALDAASPAALVTASQVLQEFADDMGKPASQRAIARNVKTVVRKIR